MEKEELKRNYRNACDEYLKAFCEKHDFDYDSCTWLSGHSGGTVEVADLYISIEEIILDIDKDTEEETFMKYYGYSMRIGFLGGHVPSYRSWLSGCPVKTEEELQHLEKLRADVEKAKEELEGLLKDSVDQN